MREWFDKLRILAVKDSGQGMPAELKKRIENSRDLQAFAKDVDSVDAALREQRPGKIDTPNEVHRSIMAAVREERHRRNEEHRKIPLGWWLPAPAAALLVLGLIQFWPRATVAPNGEATLASAVEKGMELAHTAPQQAVAPLSEELKRLRGDVQNAKEFLMASLP